MDQKTTITVLVIIAVFAGVFALGYFSKGGTAASVQNTAGGNGTSMLTTPKSVYDFGTISMKNGDVSYDFRSVAGCVRLVRAGQ